jgi:glycosyltransferase involved in cell wall biosynthesis
MASVGIVSYRLGEVDGVSVEAAKWANAFSLLGHDIHLVAGSGGDGVHLVDGLSMHEAGPVDLDTLHEELEGLDVVVVENLCSLPLNPGASSAVADVLKGRPAILRHHDLAWQRPDTAHFGAPPDDPSWRHVTINRYSQQQLAEHGIDATCLYNRFRIDPPSGDRERTRSALRFNQDDLLVVQPTRALPRKNVPGGLRLAEELEATYWLTAAAEDGYQPELDSILEGATIPVLRGQGPGSIDDVYAAADLVVLPSTWEGFGNPTIESVTHHRPLALGDYPVAAEIRSFGFRFFGLDDVSDLAAYLQDPDESLLAQNLEIAKEHFDIARLPDELDRLLDSLP